MINKSISLRGFGSVQLLQAYERGIDESVISSITDTSGTIVHVNSRFCDVSQYSPAELIGQNHRIVNSGFHPPDFFQTMWRTIGAGKVWRAEIRNKAKDASLYWVDTVVVPIKNTEGRNTHFLSLRSLITERKELEEERQRYLKELETLLVMTSHRIRKPLAECVAQMAAFEAGGTKSREDFRPILASLRANTRMLDGFTQELADFIRDMNP